MIIACRGQRLSSKAVSEMIDALDMGALVEHLRSDGYALQPVRAPKGLSRGRLRVRLSWTKTDGDISFTVRHTIALHQPELR